MKSTRFVKSVIWWIFAIVIRVLEKQHLNYNELWIVRHVSFVKNGCYWNHSIFFLFDESKKKFLSFIWNVCKTLQNCFQFKRNLYRKMHENFPRVETNLNFQICILQTTKMGFVIETFDTFFISVCRKICIFSQLKCLSCIRQISISDSRHRSEWSSSLLFVGYIFKI